MVWALWPRALLFTRVSNYYDHDHEKVNNNYQYQKMNEKKKENWISIEETKESALAVNATLMLNKKMMIEKNYIRLFYLELKWR